MVERTFPGQKISGRVFADLVKERGGSLSHSYFSNILAGKVTRPSEEILRALGLGFGVDWRFFKEKSEVVDDVVAGLQFLAKCRTGEISGIAARGLHDDELSPELLQFALSLLEDTEAGRSGSGGGTSDGDTDSGNTDSGNTDGGITVGGITDAKANPESR
ncbi:hypothetical protein [Streptomyces sp. 35G-GA-8]|uniref:hypothetical protein n=1 Tax=Streptomyces sp. 35G-GA-8 TaxID=2939434 RepID=UPI00201F18F2|nr:hypothetical protein [Streptomyces sp. 35G-GA-8]MCL7381364.1 hypothetical protein [Streptomyces sp. 35G-GA-8]